MSTPEMATIARFIERLTGSPDTPMRWYCLIGGIEPRDGTVVEVKDGIIKKQAEGTDVFVVVNEPGSVRALHIGGDGKPPERWHQEPDFIVMTDAAWQAYWLVSDCPADEFRKYQGRLTDYYGVEPLRCATWGKQAPEWLHFHTPHNSLHDPHVEAPGA